MAKYIFLGSLAVLVISALGGIAVLAWQGNRAVDTSGEYVALGSSYAAGIGLGDRAPHSPIVCMRSVAGYPNQIATLLKLKLVDMACSGSTTAHILDGGPVFLPPQLSAIGPKTKLVTITTGGNDIGYIGDLTVTAGNFGPAGKWIYGDVKHGNARDYAKITRNFVKIVGRVHKAAPAAKIVIVNYPAVLPPTGNCAALGVDDRQAEISRDVARRLDVATRNAATQAGVIFVDVAAASAGHEACSTAPWVYGAVPDKGTAFHPNAAGAAAVAALVVQAIQYPPNAIAKSAQR